MSQKTAMVLPYQALHYVAIDFDKDSGAAMDGPRLPKGALILDEVLIVHEAWDGPGAGAPAVNVGDAGSATRFFSAQALTAPGVFKSATAGYFVTAEENVKIAITQDSSTTGKATLVVFYAPLNLAEVAGLQG